jgi:signal transduction histidine kinase
MVLGRAVVDPTRSATAAEVRPVGVAVLDRHGIYLELDEVACRLLGVSAEEPPGTVSFARIPVGPDEVWWVERRPEVTSAPLMCQVSRGEADDQWLLRMTPAASSPSARAAVRGYSERALEAIAGPDRDAIVGALTDEFTRICGLGEGGLIVLIDEQSGAPTFAGGSTPRREQLAAMEECRKQGAQMVIWQAFEENRVVVEHGWARRVLRDPRLAPMRRLVESNLSLALDGSYVAVPLELASKRIGVIAWMVRDHDPITASRVSLWCDLADQVALALEYAQALHRARVSGLDRERQRLNEDLHGSAVQDVFGLKMLAARAEVDAHQMSAPGLAGQIRELRELADKVHSGLQALIGDRRQVGQVRALKEQLTGLANEMGSRSGIQIQVNIGDEWDHLSAEFRDTVVRIVQEALRNIEKHAHARTACLRVVGDVSASGLMLIEVADDGESFDPAATVSAGFGLTSIRERAAERGGSVELVMAPATVLRVWLRPSFESEWDAAHRG